MMITVLRDLPREIRAGVSVGNKGPGVILSYVSQEPLVRCFVVWIVDAEAVVPHTVYDHILVQPRHAVPLGIANSVSLAFLCIVDSA
jgi:hypothetical protein